MEENNPSQLFGYIELANGNIQRILLNNGPDQPMNILILHMSLQICSSLFNSSFNITSCPLNKSNITLR